jgi:hypothetical protein
MTKIFVYSVPTRIAQAKDLKYKHFELLTFGCPLWGEGFSVVISLNMLTTVMFNSFQFIGYFTLQLDEAKLRVFIHR